MSRYSSTLVLSNWLIVMLPKRFSPDSIRTFMPPLILSQTPGARSASTVSISPRKNISPGFDNLPYDIVSSLYVFLSFGFVASLWLTLGFGYMNGMAYNVIAHDPVAKEG
ncbi:hypothetical protein A0J61_01845 [Choanephora cucurbitarum]|uniref:Uncharacterized protein n=1 Tax=Choanephora cucurbitarum TaxID=101091 RepID=A0A1C7NM17_9FUNG|nr:hypothetical protein A0J61_01845 [Choanephora cucurbitarum]